jgi:hypothetical protein
MVELPFAVDLRVFEFQSALDLLRKSAQTGLAALRREINALGQQIEDYRRGGEFDGERDEEGSVLWERDDIISYEIDFGNKALLELRKAFAIAAYHHWERSVQRRWIAQESETAARDGSDGSGTRKKGLKSYKELSSAASIIGYETDSGLWRVMALANTLKHNSETYGKELLGLWPDIFSRPFQKLPKWYDTASAVQLTDDHLSEIFDIVSKSGPRLRT